MTSQLELLNADIEAYPSFFYTHYHSETVLTFEDSRLFARTKYQGPNVAGFKVTSKDFVANWDTPNDSIINLTNIESPLRNITKFYWIDKSLAVADLLVPDNSIELYQDSLKNELIEAIKSKPFVPDKDDLELIKADSSYLDKLRNFHYRSIITAFTNKHYELGFYYGKWN